MKNQGSAKTRMRSVFLPVRDIDEHRRSGSAVEIIKNSPLGVLFRCRSLAERAQAPNGRINRVIDSSRVFDGATLNHRFDDEGGRTSVSGAVPVQVVTRQYCASSMARIAQF